jgi:esterase
MPPDAQMRSGRTMADTSAGDATPGELVVASDGLRLRALDWGTAGRPPVLLLHGMAVHARSWDHNALAWRDAFHVVALDQRGHGESGHPPPDAPDPYTTARFSADALAVADALGWRRFSIVGQSMGGNNGMYLAAEHPDRVERLVISDMEPRFRLELMGFLREAERLPEYASHEQYIAEQAKRSPHAAPALLRHRAEHSLKRLPNGALTPKYDLHAPKRWEPLDLWPRLQEIRCPTLLVRGAESAVLRQEVAERMVQEIPDCRLVVVPNAGHSVGADNPAVYEAAIRDFLSGREPAGAIRPDHDIG